MRIAWSQLALTDLDRLQTFLAEVDLDASERLADVLFKAPEVLIDFPRRGPRLSQFDPREVRELRVQRYLFHYEIRSDQLFVLRIFHVRENRP